MRKKLLTSILLLIILISIGCSSASNKSGLESQKADDTDTVCTINGQDISRIQFMFEVSSVEYSMEQLAEAQKDHWQESSIKSFEKQIELQNKYGPKIVAFARILTNYAVYLEAEKRGYQVSEEELQEQIAETKKIHKESSEPEPKFFQDFIDKVGEEQYWNHYARQGYRRSRLIGQFKSDFQQEHIQNDPVGSWHEFTYRLAEQADVEIKDYYLLDKDAKKKALEYSKEMQEVIRIMND